jgi:hypothetical protein
MVQLLQKASPEVKKDLRMLATFVSMYCRGNGHAGREPLTLKNIDTIELSTRMLFLCPGCSKLLHHGLIKRSHCPQNPKPNCSDCPSPCYDKSYRMKIREVMRYSGWRLLVRGRVDFLFHLLGARFRKRRKVEKRADGASQFQETPARLVTLKVTKSTPQREKIGVG